MFHISFFMLILSHQVVFSNSGECFPVACQSEKCTITRKVQQNTLIWTRNGMNILSSAYDQATNSCAVNPPNTVYAEYCFTDPVNVFILQLINPGDHDGSTFSDATTSETVTINVMEPDNLSSDNLTTNIPEMVNGETETTVSVSVSVPCSKPQPTFTWNFKASKSTTPQTFENSTTSTNNTECTSPLLARLSSLSVNLAHITTTSGDINISVDVKFGSCKTVSSKPVTVKYIAPATVGNGVLLTATVSFTSNGTFGPELSNRESVEFKELYAIFIEWLNVVLSELNGYQKSIILEFSNRDGGIIVVADVESVRESASDSSKSLYKSEIKSLLNTGKSSPPQGYTIIDFTVGEPRTDSKFTTCCCCCCYSLEVLITTAVVVVVSGILVILHFRRKETKKEGTVYWGINVGFILSGIACPVLDILQILYLEGVIVCPCLECSCLNCSCSDCSCSDNSGHNAAIAFVVLGFIANAVCIILFVIRLKQRDQSNETNTNGTEMKPNVGKETNGTSNQK